MIRSTANDMLTFLAANMGITETKLQPAMQLANTPQRPTAGPDYVGLGWMVPGSGQGLHWHNGQTPGYHSFLAWDTERRIGVVVLANASVMIDDIGFAALGGLPKPFPIDQQLLAEYAGRYQFPDGVVVTIRVEGTRVFIQAPNQPEYELYGRSETEFSPLAFKAVITFCRNDSGEVDRLVLVEGGKTFEAERLP
jgi:CubicO group peptidase (beta-lactamase class C family)